MWVFPEESSGMCTVVFGGTPEKTKQEINALCYQPTPGLPGPGPGQVRLEDRFPGALHQDPQGEKGRKSVLGLRYMYWGIFAGSLITHLFFFGSVGACISRGYSSFDSFRWCYVYSFYGLTGIMYMNNICVCSCVLLRIFMCVYIQIYRYIYVMCTIK